MHCSNYEGAGLGLLPVLVEESLSVGDGRVPGEHAERGRLARSVHPQQAETLREEGVVISCVVIYQKLPSNVTYSVFSIYSAYKQHVGVIGIIMYKNRK